jgi:hypothetical protein
MHFSILRKPFDGRHFGAIGLNGKHGAGFDSVAINEDRTGPTVAGIAAHVGTGQLQVVAEELHQ